MSWLWRLTPARRHGTESIGRIEFRWFTVAGWRLHVRVSVEPVSPEAPAIVLVHGLAVSSAYMVPTAVRLAPYYRVFAPDLPGYGESDKPEAALAIPELADVLVAWMDAAGLERAVLIGNSLGCQIIVDLAVRYPTRVQCAVLQGPTIDCAARTLWQQAGRLLLDIPREHPTQPFVQARDYLRFGLRRTLRTFRFAVRDRIEEKLPHVTAPTLVVQGGRDPIVSLHWAEEVARLLPDGRLVVLPGAPHTANYSTPRAFVSVVRLFVDGTTDIGEPT